MHTQERAVSERSFSAHTQERAVSSAHSEQHSESNLLKRERGGGERKTPPQSLKKKIKKGRGKREKEKGEKRKKGDQAAQELLGSSRNK